MNQKQLSDRIGNIDERLVQRAEQMPNYKNVNRKIGARRLLAIAAAVALIVSGFAAGALAFSEETVVEIKVPVEQECIEIEEIGLSLILPDSWAGRYAFEQSEDFKEYYVYNPAIREAMGGDGETLLSGGMLFYIKLWDEQLTKEQVDAGGEWDYARCRYIMTTKNGTYLLYYASDVQFTQDTLEEYRQMEDEISDIRFVVNDVFN